MDRLGVGGFENEPSDNLFIFHAISMKILQVKCDQCGKEFPRSLARVNEAISNGSKQLCSKECLKKFHSSKEPAKCAFCEKEIQVQRSVFLKSATKRFFCDQSCSAKFNNRIRVRTAASKERAACSVASFYEASGHSPMVRVCPICSKNYKVNNARANRGLGLYCSRTCADLARSGIPQYSREELLRVLNGIYQKNNFITSKLVPRAIHHQAVKIFGSWVDAVTAAGLPIDLNNRGKKKVTCLDGHEADSAEEAFLDNWLSARGISHEINKYYPGTRLTCDFYLPEYDLWVEYLGLYGSDSSYQARFAKKQEISEKEGFRVVGLQANDIRGGEEGVLLILEPYLKEKKSPRNYLGRPAAPTIKIPCKFCGEEFVKLERKHKSDLKRGATNFFCCKSHQVKFQHLSQSS